MMRKVFVNDSTGQRITLLVFTALLLVFVSGFAKLAAAAVTDVAWAQFDGERFEIFYGHLDQGHVVGKVQVTNDQYNNMHPSMIKRKNGEFWLAWTAMNGVNNKLFYSRLSKGSWSFPAEIKTDVQSAIAPSLAVDAQDILWAAWAGFNGRNDDVYVSQWQGNHWGTPMRVHPANVTPDILPALSLEGKTLVVTWQGFDGSRYQYYRSAWNGRHWSTPERETAAQRKAREAREERLKSEQSMLGSEIKPMGKAALIENRPPN